MSETSTSKCFIAKRVFGFTLLSFIASIIITVVSLGINNLIQSQISLQFHQELRSIRGVNIHPPTFANISVNISANNSKITITSKMTTKFASSNKTNETNETNVRSSNKSSCYPNEAQKKIDDIITYDVAKILNSDSVDNYNYSNLTISQKSGYDLLALFTNKHVLLHGDSTISLFFQIVSQFLHYCTPSSLNKTILNINGDIDIDYVDYVRIRKEFTLEQDHPCGPQFCDVWWAQNIKDSLYIIDKSVNEIQHCIMKKMDFGWKNGQSKDFLSHINQHVVHDLHTDNSTAADGQTDLDLLYQKHMNCQQYINKKKRIFIYYCNDYLKYDNLEKLVKTGTSDLLMPIKYDIIIDQMALLHVFQNIPIREFSINAVQKMLMMNNIIHSKIQHHSVYDKNKTKCYVFMSTDPICEELNKVQTKWKRIQQQLNFNFSVDNPHFNLSVLGVDDLNMIDKCVTKSKKYFIYSGSNKFNSTDYDDAFIQQYCIMHAWTDQSASFVTKQIRDMMVNEFKTPFCNDNIYFYDHHKLVSQFSDRCEMKHHQGAAHSAGYYPLQLIMYLNLFTFSGC